MNSDNSARLRIVTAALFLGAILFSAILGSVTTVVHQSAASVAGVSLPWGLILSLTIVFAWFIGLSLLKSPRWVLVSCGAAFLLMVFMLSQRGPGGSVLVPESWQGNTWVLLVPLAVIVIVLWPRIPAKKAPVKTALAKSAPAKTTRTER